MIAPLSLAEFAERVEPARPVLRQQAGRHVNVAGQYDECVDVKWAPLVRAPRGLTQGFDLVSPKTAATIAEICCEEPASSRDKCATVIWHPAG